MGIIKTLSVESHYAEYRYGMLILLCWVSHFLIHILSVVMLSDVISEGLGHVLFNTSHILDARWPRSY